MRFITILLILLLLPFVHAESEICDYIIQERGIKEGFSIPSFIPYNNDRFNVFDFNNNSAGSIIIEEGVITHIGCDQIENATVDIKVKNVQTLKDIYAAEDVSETFDEKLDNEIITEGKTTGTEVKLFFTKIALKIISWF